MSPLWLSPSAVAPAQVRPVPSDAPGAVEVQHLEVQVVASPEVVPRQPDPVALRLMALQRENERLRAELDALRSAG